MHLGTILDGNRRFAKKSLKTGEVWKGHEVGAGKVEEFLEWVKELGIEETTIYCFSLENFKRKKKEVDFLMKILEKEFLKLEKDPRLEKDGVRINFAGDLNLLNTKIRMVIERLKEKTKHHKNFIVNFAIAYGGRQEIINAIKETVKKGEEITEENISKNLWIPSNLDLVIRTGGEKRTSNFMPWQSVYSEWVFLDKMWPEITKEDLEKAISEFNNRERRFGK